MSNYIRRFTKDSKPRVYLDDKEILGVVGVTVEQNFEDVIKFKITTDPFAEKLQTAQDAITQAQRAIDKEKVRKIIAKFTKEKS